MAQKANIWNVLCFAAFATVTLACATSGLAGPATDREFPVLSGPYLGQTPPGDTPVMFAPGIVSTGHQHGSAYFTPAGTELVFSWTDFKSPPLILHTKEVDGRWVPPDTLVDATLTPCFSPDGNTIFISYRSRIALMRRTATGWSDPVDLGDEINFGKRQDFPSVATDGTLYYSVMFGQDGIYFAEQSPAGGYRVPQRVEIKSKNEYVRGISFIAPDERYIIFSSFEFDSRGMSDLFICFRRADGTWSYPKNLGSKINSTKQDMYPTVTRDGRYLFFMSTRPSDVPIVGSGAGNVYWVSAGFIDTLRPDR